MIGEDFLAQMGFVKVEIKFGGRYALMTEHLLYGSQIGSSFEQMSRKRMTESVRRN